MSVQVIDRGWEHIKEQLKLAEGSFVKVGFPGEKEKQHKGAEMSIARLAAIQELGNDETGIPPRPFMSTSFDRSRGEIDHKVKLYLDAIFKGKITTEGALNRLGGWFVDQVRKTIRAGGFKANKPATIARKGSAVPLIDDGIMIGSLDFETVMK